MNRIEVLPDNTSIDIVPGETILDAALRAGLPLPHQCNGIGRCSTCRVWVLSGEENLEPRSEVEQRVAKRLHLEPRVRLGCQTSIRGDMTVRRMVLDVAEQTAARADEVGDERTMGIMFTDLRDFTPFAEGLPPHDVIFILDRYYDRMSGAVKRHGGTINNFMGDGLLVLFEHGTPAEITVTAAKAVLEMQTELADFNTFLDANYGARLRMGIGLHIGRLVSGSIGQEGERLSAVIGDSVNLASRIETATKKTKADVLASAEFVDAAGDAVHFGRRVRVRLKGKRGKHTLREVSAVAGQEPAAQRSIRKGSMMWYRALPARSLEAGRPVAARAGELQVLIAACGGNVYAFEARCPHMRLPLSVATVQEGCELQCAWHHSRFALDTGEVRAWAPWPNLVGPVLGALRQRRHLTTYRARVLKGWVWVGVRK